VRDGITVHEKTESSKKTDIISLVKDINQNRI
jgi:hypothetical protein